MEREPEALKKAMQQKAEYRREQEKYPLWVYSTSQLKAELRRRKREKIK